MAKNRFEWDERKNAANVRKHGISFFEAQYAFMDTKRVMADDLEHSGEEQRHYCFGKVNDGIMTVCFTRRGDVIRIISAGYRRKGKAIYEKENTL